MKDARVIEKNQVTWLQPVTYQSRRIAEEVGQLTVGSIVLFEQRALEWQRGDRAVVVMNGAGLLARVHLEHGSLYGEVHVAILKAIQDRRLSGAWKKPRHHGRKRAPPRPFRLQNNLLRPDRWPNNAGA